MSGHRKGGGWIAFAGIVLILSGINTFLNGLWAIGASNNVEESFKDTLLFSDTNLDTWGWIYLIARLPGSAPIAAGAGTPAISG